LQTAQRSLPATLRASRQTAVLPDFGIFEIATQNHPFDPVAVATAFMSVHEWFKKQNR
jgi:hypothetical protein